MKLSPALLLILAAAGGVGFYLYSKSSKKKLALTARTKKDAGGGLTQEEEAALDAEATAQPSTASPNYIKSKIPLIADAEASAWYYAYDPAGQAKIPITGERLDYWKGRIVEQRVKEGTM